MLIVGGMLLLITLILGFARQDSPRSPWIVFRKLENNEIRFYRMRPDGSAVQHLYRIPKDAHEIRFSPDGRWIVYPSQSEKNRMLHRVHLDGSGRREVVEASHLILSMEWSPDSQQIVYTTLEETRVGVYTVRVADSSRQQIPGLPLFIYRSVWSPDGEWLLFGSNFEGEENLFRVRVDGSGFQAVTEGSRIDDYPDWSPDGENIIFISTRAAENGQIYRLSLADGQVRRLTSRDVNYFDLSYSPDGQWIVFIAQQLDDWKNGIYRMRPDGSDLEQLTSPDELITQPQWFPLVDLPMRVWLLAGVGVVMSGAGLRGFYA